MARLYDLARMTTATTGTGTITLGSAVASFLTFAQAGVANGDTVTYAIVEGANREIGRGVYTSSGTTLTRATILRSTNSNAAITLAGAAEVFIAAAAEDIAPQTAAEQLTVRTTLFAAPLDAVGCNNLIANGAMLISQQFSAPQTVDSNLNYMMDQWEERISNANSGVYQVGQVNISTPTSIMPFQNCFQLKATTGATVSAGDYATMQQKIEGFVAQKLNWGATLAMPLTIGFWVRCTISGTMTVIVSNSSSGTRTYATNVTVSAANTWEYKTVTIPADNSASGGWTFDQTVGLVIRFSFACGSTFATSSPDTWIATANVRGTTSTTNFLATTNNVCQVSGVSAFAGNDVPTGPFAMAASYRYDDDLRRCMRYWYTWNREAGSAIMIGVGSHTSGTQIDVPFVYPVIMVATPTLTIAGAASDFEAWVGANNGNLSALVLNKANNRAGNLQGTHAIPGTSAASAGYIVARTTSARLHFNARL